MAKSIPIDQKILAVVREIYAHRLLMVSLFCVLSLTILSLAVMMPKKYTASSQILAEDENIIRPLLQGQAVTAHVADELSIAKQLLFSQKIMDDIVANEDWGVEKITPFIKAKLIDKIQANTKIKRSGNNLIVISYTDKNPIRAYNTIQRYTHLFIAASKDEKKRDAEAAYTFIDSQVNAYKAKLTHAEKKAGQFKQTHNEDTEQNILARINELRKRIKETELTVQELKIRGNNIGQQLLGETQISKAMVEKQTLNQQLKMLQANLSTLQIKYRDQYPDIIALKKEINLLQQRLAELPETPVITDSANEKNSPPLNQVYDSLRNEHSRNSTELQVMQTRLAALNHALGGELDTMKQVESYKAVLAELERDYNVNRSLYEDLLKRRENARVSMTLEVEGHGLTFKIKEEAMVPSTPSTPGFLQMGVLGLFLSLSLPMGLMVLWVELNAAIRHKNQLPEGLPVIATIKTMTTQKERRRVWLSNVLWVLLMLTVFFAYAVVGFLKMKGMI